MRERPRWTTGAYEAAIAAVRTAISENLNRVHPDADTFANLGTAITALRYDYELHERREVGSPRVVDEPVKAKARCKQCKATIEYLPEDKQHVKGVAGSDEPSTAYRVKCPRGGCPGYADVPPPTV